MNLLESTYKGKKVLLTGHTGFKGSWLSLWLNNLGANVAGVSVDVPTKPSNFEASNVQNIIRDIRLDVCDLLKLKEIISEEEPDFIFHLAAQPIVSSSYSEPIKTMITNSIGSANILESLRDFPKKTVAIMITSDKAYDNVEWEWGYRETDRLGGKDPYSASKAMAELAISTYFNSYFSSNDNKVKIGIARAGNVIGGGDWAKDRIIADCVRAWSEDKIVEIRNPHATRPWQHVLEPLSGYLTLGHFLSESSSLHGEAYNFGPSSHYNHSVRELIEMMKNFWKGIEWNDVSNNIEEFHEAGLLKLNCDKALSHLRWLPVLNFEETIKMTVDWYRIFYSEKRLNMFEYTNNQIEEYMKIASKKGIYWANEKN